MPVRVFLDWTEPTARTVASWLHSQSGHPLVLVPTQQAGRRLRAAGVEEAHILTPARFLDSAGGGDPVASALRLAADLDSPRARRCPALFPAGVPARDFGERLMLARSLLSLRTELAENGFTLEMAAERLSPGSADGSRWHDLARLLGRATADDVDSARLAFAENPTLPPGCDSVVIAAVPDLQPLVVRALESLNVPISVLIPAPDQPNAFDPWGRPLPAAWADRDPGWRNFASQVTLVARPDQLELPSTGDLEIGVLDRELIPVLRAALSPRPLHDPTGEPLERHWLVRALEAFARAADEPDFSRVIDLLRNGAVCAWLAGIDLDSALTEADAVQAAHFPATLRAARPWLAADSALSAAIARLEETFARFRENASAAASALMIDIATAFGPSLDESGQAALVTARESVQAALDRLGIATKDFPRLAPGDWLSLLRAALASESLYSVREVGAVEASGWLELPWSEAGTIVLTGMNLGRLPVPIGGEMFLTASVRATLGLAGAEERRARDAYLLARLLAQRRAGDVIALVGQLDAEGSPLQPSPLLFAGAADELPARVERLFDEPRPPRPDPAWQAGWQFDPPVVEMPRRISVTDFSRYLDCPFTFYLARILKMETFAPASDELDAAQFGDVMHIALEGWALDPSVNSTTDAGKIQAALDSHLDEWVRRHLGRSLSLPLRVQIESARHRLHAFAAWQAQDAAAGWRVQGVELKFADILGRPWELDGWTIAGRVDRLDRNERDGSWRVIDYKTFDTPDSPAKKHRRAFRTAREWPRDYARSGDPVQWWINLQLPLYRQLLIESGRQPDQIGAGYFNLPKTTADTGLQIWEELDDTLQTSALVCARGVLADLAARRFWPPNPRAEHADFAEFFPPDPTRIIDPEGAFRRSCAP